MLQRTNEAMQPSGGKLSNRGVYLVNSSIELCYFINYVVLFVDFVVEQLIVPVCMYVCMYIHTESLMCCSSGCRGVGPTLREMSSW